MSMPGEDVSVGTWTLEGDKITVTIDDAPVQGTVSEGRIVLAQDGMEMVFTREAVEAITAAFAPAEPVLRHHGMRPLSRYAQVHPVTEDDLTLAARVAYFEAGPRSERAYRAVLCVLYNRCVATRFGGKVTDIATETYRKGQFSVVHNKRFQTFDPPEAIREAARDIFVYGNLDLPENVLFFCAERIGKNFGGHPFYRNIGGNLFFFGSVD